MKKLKLDDVFETDRLIIKIPDVSEWKIMYELIDDTTSKFMEWSKWVDITDSEKNLFIGIDECKKWKSWQAAVYLKNWDFIGRFWMHTLNDAKNSIMLWYWLATKFWWNGYVSECVEWIKEYWFTQMGLDKITIRCVKENTASARVAEKAWFKLDGIIRHDSIHKWEYVDNCYYTFLKEDYKK